MTLAAIWLALTQGAAPAGAQTCAGDCNGDGTVTVAELQTATAIALGEAPAGSCAAISNGANGVVRVPELTSAVRAAVNGCGAAPQVRAAAAPATAPVLQIGSAAGMAGQTVSVGVILQSAGQSIAGVQVDIAFNRVAPIAANPSQRPACTVNPSIDKNGTAFAFLPSGCTPGVGCTGIRSLVLALDNVLPIPDGSTLFTCNVAIGPTAANGVYPLHGSNAGASDPFGNAIAIQPVDGAITVGVVPTQTPTTSDAPATLILHNARLQASDGIRLGRGLGGADLEAAVDINPPFGSLIDDVRSSGLSITIGTDGQSFPLVWTAGQCALKQTGGGPSIRCQADDFDSHRIVTLHPTRLPNVLAMKLRVRHLNLRPPLSTAPVDVSLVTATFRRPDDIGDCAVSGKGMDSKTCREHGVQPSPTPTASATGTVTNTGTATGTATWTPTVTRTRTPTRTTTIVGTPTNTRTPTATLTPTPVVVPTGALGERAFSIDEPGALFAGTAAARGGLFTSYLNGENAADDFSSGPLVLVGGVPDAQGVAPLSLKNDVTLTFGFYDGSWACFELFAAGSSGSIDCDGGTAYDVQGSQPSGDVGTAFTTLTGLGAPAAPGNGALLVMGQGQHVPSGPMPDCSTIAYTDPPQPFAYTTTTATALKGSTQLSVTGEPFACNQFSTPGTGGMLVTPAPAYQAPYGDLANVFRLAEQSPCPLDPGSYTFTSLPGATTRISTLSAFSVPSGASILADIGLGDANCVHDAVVPYPGGFSTPVFCVPALGYTVAITQTGCGVGQIDSDGGSDFTVFENGDSSYDSSLDPQASSTCHISEPGCRQGHGPAPDSSILLRTTVGDGVTDICSAGSANALLSIPVQTVTWLALDSFGNSNGCPDADGMLGPTDQAIVQFAQILDLTTDRNTATFEDLDGDGCSFTGAGPIGGAPNYAPVGSCIDPAQLGNGARAVTAVAAGVVGSSGVPLFDLAFTNTLPMSMDGPAPPLGATCVAPPAINFTGTVDRCIIGP